ncbi:hypothetical protein TcasGA2_TC033065 [Tribolium castaneum]|uniref:G-protein coupled receptors family 2 profile 1 domain-containing protein n=1 Tax=Tribolium castaneum TaxID=7070 RepID=A0A139WIE3_TRICA|nr:hypothetical protein TcasGA2_TC033065 [Tribolium castaneum]
MAVTILKQIVLLLLLHDVCGKDENPDIDKIVENNIYATIFQDSTTSSTTSSTASSTDFTTSSTISPKPPPQQLMCKRENDSTLGLWPPTPAGAWATPVSKICLHSNYTPVRRHCSENATWEKPDATSCDQVKLTNVTKSLDDLFLNNTDSPKAINTLVNLTAKDQETFIPFDVYLLSEILNKASENEDIANNPSNFTKVVSNIMNLEKQTMTRSQQLLNTTDAILDSLDKLLLKTKSFNVTEPKLLIRTINVTNNVLGAMIRSTNASFNYFEIIELTDDTPLQNENFEVAFLVPPSFAKDHYYITLFYNDYLFNQNESATVGSWILSILMPESTHDDNSTIQIYFKEFGKHAQQLCHHWKYGKDENLVAIWGKWQYDSVGKKLKEGFYICEVNHTTHFGIPDYNIWVNYVDSGDYCSYINGRVFQEVAKRD